MIISKNQIIIATIVSLIFFIVIYFFKSNTSKHNNDFKLLSKDKATALIHQNTNNSYFKIIDVRTKEEFDKGHIKDSLNIDFYDPNFANTIRVLNKNNTYLIYCRTNNRSLKTYELMKELGFNNIYVIEDGYSEFIKRFP